MTASPRYSLRWSAQAERDVDDIADRIARHDAVAARAWIDRVIHVENVAAIPLAGRVVPELAQPDLRETFLGRYRIVYRVERRVVCVVTVFAGERHGWPEESDPDALSR